jgi:hemoglobin
VTRALDTGLHHRALIDQAPHLRPFRDTGLFERIGGQPTVDRLVDHLYDAFDKDELLRPLFPKDLFEGRAMQKLFFAEWLGGPRHYSEEAHASLGHRHESLKIPRSLAGRWLGHFRQALAATVASDEDRNAIFAEAQTLALALVNEAPRSVPEDEAEVSWRKKGKRVVGHAAGLARRGDVAGVDAALAASPQLLRPTFAAAIMQAASLAGRVDVVKLLLDRGVGADHPFYLPVGVVGSAFERVLYVTPLCSARMKRRTPVQEVLIAAGAREDIFTAAFRGDLLALAQMLQADVKLARATDPAVDVLDITPIDHAVAGGQPHALRLLLDRAGRLATGGVRALRGAAAQDNVEMVELLLAHGADATRIGVGRWVLHPELAPLLARHGASIDSSGSWIGASCTGNQGRKDDPDYVRALLGHGARADDRRSGDPGRTAGVDTLDATALHYASKAGFLQTMKVLLENGADPDAHDSRGRTPLDWLDDATRNVDRASARDLLQMRQH